MSADSMVKVAGDDVSVIWIDDTVMWRGMRCKVVEFFDINGRAAACLDCGPMMIAYAWVGDLNLERDDVRDR